MLKRSLIFILVCTFGCSEIEEDPVKATCTHKEEGFCTYFFGPENVADELLKTCLSPAQPGKKVECSPNDQIGVCDKIKQDQNTITKIFYKPKFDATTAQGNCNLLGGNWSAK